MKKIFTRIIRSLISMAFIVLVASTVFAQAPGLMNYQAVVRDAANKLVVNKTVGVQISILQGSATGTVVYTETQKPTTNINGLISLEIGSGASFANIDWTKGPFFIMTKIDPAGGTNYSISGTSQILSVPYAIAAQSAYSITGPLNEKDPIFIAWDKSTGIKIKENQITDLKHFTTADETDPIFKAWNKSTGITITESQISNLKHFTNANETDPIFTAWDKSTGIKIKENQITDLKHFTSADEKDPIFGASPAKTITNGNIAAWNNKSDFSGSYLDLTNKPVNVSTWVNDAGYQKKSEDLDTDPENELQYLYKEDHRISLTKNGRWIDYTLQDAYFWNDSITTTHGPVVIYAPTGGAIKLMDGTQGLNKVWVSDANGLGHWQLIMDANVDPNANIQVSKLLEGDQGELLVTNAGVPVWTTAVGDVLIEMVGGNAVTEIQPDSVTTLEIRDLTVQTIDLAPNSVDSTKILASSIFDSEVAPGAEIQVSKLRNADVANQVLTTGLGNTNPAWSSSLDLPGTLDVSGAVTLDNTLTTEGLTTINDNLVVNGNVSVNEADGVQSLVHMGLGASGEGYIKTRSADGSSDIVTLGSTNGGTLGTVAVGSDEGVANWRAAMAYLDAATTGGSPIDGNWMVGTGNLAANEGAYMLYNPSLATTDHDQVRIAVVNGLAPPTFTVDNDGDVYAADIDADDIMANTFNGNTITTGTTGGTLDLNDFTLNMTGDADLQGTNTGDQVAGDVGITDAGGYYTATDVEGALQEGDGLANAINAGTAGNIQAEQIANGLTDAQVSNTLTSSIFEAGTGTSPAVDLNSTEVDGILPVANGGTGRATGSVAYSLIATGTSEDGPQQTVPNGATDQILVGGGETALPVWTNATGTGAPVRASSPTLITPDLGVATATSINGLTLTAPATSATLTIADNKTFTANNSLTLSGTDATTMTFPSVSSNVALTKSGGALTNGNVDFSLGNVFTYSTGSNTTFNAVGGIQGGYYTIIITNTATTTVLGVTLPAMRTMNWGTNMSGKSQTINGGTRVATFTFVYSGGRFHQVGFVQED